MEYSKTTTATATSTAAAALKMESSTRHSASSSSTLISVDSLSSRPPVILTPCAACKILRRRCVDKSCVLAPYFPPTEPHKFTIAHRVFGASNIIKLLQELPEGQRADAVNSMVYEANARLRDPIYGCAGAICHLQKQINELQAEVAKAQAEILNMQCQNASLSEQLICKKHEIMMNSTWQLQYDDHLEENNFPHELIIPSVFDEAGELAINVGSVAANWEPLWT